MARFSMKLKYILEWKEKAEHDYEAVSVLLKQRKIFLSDIICYHAHQCIEKYLKGLFAKHEIKIPKTHDLIFLLDQLKVKEADLELMKDILRELNRFAVEMRYPGESATRKEAIEAAKQLKEIRKILLNKLT